jgi:hypothetical protein
MLLIFFSVEKNFTGDYKMAMAPKKMRGGGMVKKMRGGGMVKKMELGGAVGGAGAGKFAGAGAGTLARGASSRAAGAAAGKGLAAAAGKRAAAAGKGSAAGKGLGAGKELAPPALQPKRPSQPEDAKGVRTFEQSLSDFRKQATARGYNLVPNKKNK